MIGSNFSFMDSVLDHQDFFNPAKRLLPNSVLPDEVS